MAKGQNITELGIDISSFTPEKLRILDDYIKMFNQLEKFNGKVFSPVLGGGLLEFNNSVKETNRLLTELNGKIGSLGSSMNSTASSTSNATNATNQNTQANINNANSQAGVNSQYVKQLEGLTRIAAARVREAAAAVTSTTETTKNAQAYLSAASNTDKAVASNEAYLAIMDQISAASAQNVAAKAQVAAADEQLNAAEAYRMSLIEAEASVIAASDAMIVRGKVAQINANSALILSEKQLESAHGEVAAVYNVTTNQQNGANQAAINANTKEFEAITKVAAAESRKSAIAVSSLQTEVKQAEAIYKKANADTKAATSADLHTKAMQLNAAVGIQKSNADTQLVAAENQVAAAQARVAASVNLGTKEQAAAKQALTRANIQLNAAQASVTRGAAAEVAAIKTTTSAIETAKKSTTDLGASARAGFGFVRQLAYILPGLGIAGIFNFAFIAIEKVTEAIAGVSSKFEALVDIEVGYNDILKERIDIQKTLIDQRNKLVELATQDSSYKIQTGIDISSAMGKDKLNVGQQKVDLATSEYQTARAALPTGTDINTVYTEISRVIAQQTEIDKRLKDAEYFSASKDATTLRDKASRALQILLSAGNSGGIDGVGQVAYRRIQEKIVDGEYRGTPSELEAAVKGFKSELELKKTNNVDKLKLLQDFFDKEKALQVANQSQVKAIEDDNRKLSIGLQKLGFEDRIKEQEREFEDELNSERKKLKALDNIAQGKKDVARIKFENIDSDNSNTPNTKALAKLDYESESANITKDTEVKKENVREAYRQKRLSANLTIISDEYKAEAIHQKRISESLDYELSDRLIAYTKYIQLKARIEDFEQTRNNDVKPRKTGDKTASALLRAEYKDMMEAKSSLQANAEKEVFDIVSTSLDKQFKAVKDANDKNAEVDKIAYTKELKDLTDSFEAKKISYEKYEKQVKATQKKYNISGAQEDVDDDLEDIKRLRSEQLDVDKGYYAAKDKLEVAENNLKVARDGKNEKEILFQQFAYDQALGEFSAYTKAKEKIELEMSKTTDKLRKDELRVQIERIDKEAEAHKKRMDWLRAWAEMEKAIYKAAKEIGDSVYDERSRKVIAYNKIVQESLDHEISAIEKSSLSAKDKAALDIQLNARKDADNKKAAQEEKRIAHDKAVYDRDISIAHIVLSTAIAIAEANPVVPLMVAAGVVGAAELATAVAVKIPSYSLGTEDHPGGYARYGEDGAEVVKEPGKSPYLVLTETISYLPKGTEVIPINDSPVFGEKKQSDGWEQTRWLAKQYKKNQQKISFNPTIVNKVDLGFASYKRQILGN